MDEIMKAGQAAEILGVTTQTVRRYVAMGQLEATRTPGGHRRITRQSVEALAARSREPRNVRVVDPA